MKTWLTLKEFNKYAGGQIGTGSRVLLDGREGTVCADPYFYGRVAVHFDGTDEYAINITDDRREILVHRSAVEHTNGIKENPNEPHS